MDDELKAIQADLDKVLERLEAYIDDKKTAYKLFEMESPHGGNPKAEMRDALYLYLSNAGIGDIDSAISRASAERGAASLERYRRIREQGQEKGKLLFAMEELARHRPLLANYSPSNMVQPEDMANLAEMASRYLNQEDQYPGEYGSKQALKRKGRRARYTVEQREAAMKEYIWLRREHGKYAYPLERDACQPIADKHGIESGQAIVDAVRQRLDESFLTGSSNGGIVLTTLRKYLSIND